VRFKQQGAGAVFPGVFETQLNEAVRPALEPLHGESRTGDIAAKTLQLAAVTSIHQLLGMHIDPAHLGDGLIGGGGGAAAGRHVLRHDEPQRGLTRPLAGYRDAPRCRCVAGSEAGLLHFERVWLVVLHLRVERAAVSTKDLLDACGGTAGDVCHLGACGCRQGMEDEWAGVGCADVDAVKDEQMKVDIESQSAIRALDGSDGAGVCLGHAAQTE
jgi:hypothetical protein